MKKSKKSEKNKIIRDYIKEYNPYKKTNVNIRIADLVNYAQKEGKDGCSS